MKEGHKQEAANGSQSKPVQAPAFQIICLASGGGPSEDSVTGFLIRSVATKWARNSILALDAGSHLASITRLLEPHFPLVSDTRSRNKSAHDWNASIGSANPSNDGTSTPSQSSASASPEPDSSTVLETGPFAGAPFPHESARANGLWFVRECVSTYLITHPHLDHFSAFAINTAAFHNTSRPKRVAALPSTVNAIKNHIFNDIIWPNLTDEDGGVGFVTFQRLVPGGNQLVGEGSGKGYMEVCDGLCVKGMKISHGHCTRAVDAIPKRGSDVGLSEPTVLKGGATSTASEGTDQRKMSGSLSQPTFEPQQPPPADHGCHEVVVDSTAFFVRDDATGREVLFFGDVEPDSLSLNPRTIQVWTEAAPKIAHGNLKAIMIECSYDDSQADAVLFGHLNPRHLFMELQTLAEIVRNRKHESSQRRANRKRKHNLLTPNDGDMSTAPPTDDEGPGAAKRRTQNDAWPPSLPGSKYNNSLRDKPAPRPAGPTSGGPAPRGVAHFAPLAGLTVVVIHVKDRLLDGPVVGDKILRQLKQHDSRLKEADGVGLGCEFVISERGESYWF